MITSHLILSTLQFIHVKTKLEVLLIDKAKLEVVRAGAALILEIRQSD